MCFENIDKTTKHTTLLSVLYRAKHNLLVVLRDLGQQLWNTSLNIACYQHLHHRAARLAPSLKGGTTFKYVRHLMLFLRVYGIRHFINNDEMRASTTT